MRIYVDELPKSCYKCPYAFDGTDCILLNVLKGNVHYYILYDLEKRHEECPLHSLADYTKQVRKEVCEDIKKKADIEYYEEYDGFDRKIGKTYIIRDYDLDQIQGETK
jgi:hypothetical protein